MPAFLTPLLLTNQRNLKGEGDVGRKELTSWIISIQGDSVKIVNLLGERVY